MLIDGIVYVGSEVQPFVAGTYHYTVLVQILERVHIRGFLSTTLDRQMVGMHECCTEHFLVPVRIREFIWVGTVFQCQYLQPIITQYFIDNKSEIWLLFLIAHSKR